MSNLAIKIKTNNVAFDDNIGGELARILRKYADRIEHGEPDNISLMDFNGNVVGQAEYYSDGPTCEMCGQICDVAYTCAICGDTVCEDCLRTDDTCASCA